jgi:RNA polymerase sigma-70 factor (ECF subfamily)
MPDSEPSLLDRDLIAAAQKGDRTAFESLVRRYDRDVLQMALGYTHNADDAKDIYQEVFIRVFKALPKFEFRSEFRTWLFRIATNVCLDFKSKAKENKQTPIDVSDDDSLSLSETLEGDGGADQAAIDGDIRDLVEHAMTFLSPQQKLVFTLRHYQDYKLKDIAVLMNCTEGTVKKYLFTATERMREKLKPNFN